MRIDDNVELRADGTTACSHCGHTLGDSRESPLRQAIKRERSSREAGPSVHADADLFVDRAIVLRQLFCPGCLVLLLTEIVPADEPTYRSWSVPA